ncbi:hypothetical protein I3271_09335 [Photobacterium leiognathi]|uniref:hypothetical protein n=1 Tax=Photobacterium leiognathi TaxID=553611 RepID=UPI001EDE699B|nr:hypothetical protein [Photobacterium leiognathi]MCG3884890.1 hypothetical protein [Photobacterium leiognathi]
MLASKSLNEVLRFSTPDASVISPEAALDRFNDERYSDPKGCWAAKWSGKPKAGCKRIGTSFTEDVKLPHRCEKNN